MLDSFPENFIWGSSTSPHQVEGNNSNNDWWKWEQTGAIQASDKACDHYHKFKEDFLLVKDLRHNAHRFGIEWSRLEKEEGTWDNREWDHYSQVIDELLRLGIEPIINLSHFTVPLWLARNGGWTNNDTPSLFSRFAVKAYKEFGSRIKYWITINEPHMAVFIPFFYGKWTPCGKKPESAFLALKNYLKAHVKSYGLIHSIADRNPDSDRPLIGIAKAVAAMHPCNPDSPDDVTATEKRNFYHNHCFISSTINGEIDIPTLPRETLKTKNSLDFIGLNYYYRQFINTSTSWENDPLGGICECPRHNDDMGQKTDMGWEIYPKGLYEVSKEFSKYGIPLMITENGLATTDDTVRKSFIKEHLKALLRAVAEGSPVIGYLHWSLLDNFEWSEGFKMRFGLINVNYETLERTVKDSAKYYSEIISSGKIPN